MNRIASQFFMMPINLMLANFEFMVRSLNEVDAFAQDISKPEMISSKENVFQDHVMDIGVPYIRNQSIEERKNMNHMQTYSTHYPEHRQTQGNRCYVSDCDPYQSFNDCDLSSEGVIKRIRWYVTFTKEDYIETLYESKRDEIITEDTTHDRVWGEKKGVFITLMAAKKIKAPKSWLKDSPEEATIKKGKLRSLDREGLEDYLDIQIELVARSCEVKPCYEKDQVAVLRSLSSAVQRMDRNLVKFAKRKK